MQTKPPTFRDCHRSQWSLLQNPCMTSLTAIAERLLHFAMMNSSCAASPLLSSREAVTGQAPRLAHSQGCPSSAPHQKHPRKHPEAAPLGSQASWAGLEQGRSLPGAKTDGLCPVFLLEKLLLSSCCSLSARGSPPLALRLPHSQPSFEHQLISIQCCELLHFCYAKPAGGWVTQGMNSQITYSANSLTKKKP